MSKDKCQYTLKRGNRKGKLCEKPAPHSITGMWVCGVHKDAINRKLAGF